MAPRVSDASSTAFSYGVPIATVVPIASGPHSTGDRLPVTPRRTLVVPPIDVSGTEEDFFRLLRWGVTTGAVYSWRREVDARPLSRSGAVMMKATEAQRAAVNKFLAKAKRVEDIRCVYAQFAEGQDTLVVWAVVSAWSWDIADTVADMALEATEDNPTVPVVFDLLTLDSRTETDLKRATRGGERLHVRS